jgi:hypothetical protein
VGDAGAEEHEATIVKSSGRMARYRFGERQLGRQLRSDDGHRELPLRVEHAHSPPSGDDRNLHVRDFRGDVAPNRTIE